MKNISLTIAIFASLILSNSGLCQNWKKTYSYPGRPSVAYSVTETYDNGYILLSNFIKAGGNLHTGWLIKTDVNGNKLWERIIGNYDGYQSVYEEVIETSDKGIAIPGSWSKEPYSNSPDPLFLKLDVCGNLEWCRYFKTDDHMDFGVDMIEVPGGYVGLMQYYGNDYVTQRIALTKFDLIGEIQWVHIYHSDSSINEEGRSVLLRSDGDIMITGEASVIKPGNPYQQPRPLFVLCSPNGDLKDYGIFDVSDTLWAIGWQSLEHDEKVFYSSGGCEINPPFSYPYPYVFKTSYDNKELLSSNILIDSSEVFAGVTHFIDRLNDSTYVLDYAVELNNEIQRESGLLIIDTLLTMGKRRTLCFGSTGVTKNVSSIEVTLDQKILATTAEWQENVLCSVLFKLNCDLEDDSLYTTPYIYDWACPGGVDTLLTIDPECGVYVDIDELERLPDHPEIKAFPNPVSDVLTISLPEYLVTRSAQHNMQASVYNRDYQKDSRLELYDINGGLKLSRPLISGQMEVRFDSRGLSPGMYLVRLVHQNREVSTVKVMKE